MEIKKTFVGARMNKALDERLIPDGEYIDAMNIRISSDEDGEAGSAENAKGNERLTTLFYDGQELDNAVCIGTIADESKSIIYWFVTSPTVDMIVSFNVDNNTLKYHVVSTSVLNFNEQYPVNGVNLIDNLLFFTDNFNQPRRINVQSTYAEPIAGVDQITEDDISVIVKPPISAPEITLITSPAYNNYIEDKFIRFSYRYKYINGEYSALSEFSDLAFSPGQFRLDYSSYDMTGMRNIANKVNVTFNTGDERVVGVDLCFKLSNNNVVSVISRFDKQNEGWSDNAEQTITFDNQKIYTTLQQSELLRVYDNVPKLAKAQTTLGNRIFYGNYVDGYNIDESVDYSLDLISEDIGVSDIFADESNGDDYEIDTTTTITDSQLDLDLSGIELVEGASIYINLSIEHDSFGGDASYGTSVTNSYSAPFQFILPRDYTSVSDLASDAIFLSAIELTDTVANASSGYSLSDLFYASIAVASDWTLVDGGVTALGQGFVVSSNGNILSLQVPALKIEDDLNPGTFAYEYFSNSAASSATFVEINSRSSLHSNRDYEVGIVYMDEYNRASTVLVDTDNTVNVPANLSENKNSIRLNIINKAPEWAKRYRLMMKPSKGQYDTIYTNRFYYDESQASWWLNLEGDNQTKCKVGDTLYVKVDSSGATNAVVTCKVLELKTLAENDIPSVTHPPGLYMKVRNSGFNISKGDVEDYLPGRISASTSGIREFSDIAYPVFIPDPGGALTNKPVPIPAGSQVEIYFKNERIGSGSSCVKKKFLYDKTFIASQDYDNIYDFITAQNIDLSIPSNDVFVDSAGDLPTASFTTNIGNENSFTTIGGETFIANSFLSREAYVTKIGYMYDSATGEAWLGFKNAAGTNCGGRRYRLSVDIKIFTAGGLLVFETKPDEVNSEVFFEGQKSYPIINRNHQGNIQNQTDVANCIVDLDMFNCFSFGNGVESFKIDDGIATPGFNIGERFSAVAEQDYKEAHRYSDITYSGVYNEETNINKLNEFNLGLVNYRLLERLFGHINRLHGRQTDILVLQEDKISYLLAGKNLLSDAAGGGTLTSVPEVLGTQISRIEEFGISDDADSFAVYGYDVFFTDTKRGAVLNLRGGSSSSDQLNVISQLGMRTWFRDKFIDKKDNLKIGGYDPYSAEYVLNFSELTHPEEPDTIECGQTIRGSGNYDSIVLQTSNAIGTVTITYDTEEDADILVTYNGVDVIDTTVNGSGSLSFKKSLQSVNEYSASIQTTGTWEITLGCVETQPLTIINVVTSDISQEGLFTKQNHFWFDGIVTSTQSAENEVQLLDVPLSLYTVEDGFESEGYFPANNATVVMRSPDTINRAHDVSVDKMYYLISDTLYDDISDILPLATEITNVFINNGVVTRSFLYNNVNDDRYLYMIWSYGNPSGGGLNVAPFAYNNLFNTEKNVAVATTLTGFDPDGDTLSYTVTVNPTHGTLSGTAPNLTYTPNTDYLGFDSFKFKVNDGTVDSNIATVTINVTEPLSLTPFSVIITGDANDTNSCISMGALGIRFHDGAGAYPTIGDFVYDSTGGGYVLFNGGNLWYRMDNNVTVRINSSGQVQEEISCI
jgi:hypothetical protein